MIQFRAKDLADAVLAHVTFVADSFEKHNDFRIARKFSDESFYLILIDKLYMFFPELRIVTIRLSMGTGSSAAQDIAELGMKHANSSSTDKNWAWLVSTKVDISTLADKSTRDRRNNLSEVELPHPRFSCFSFYDSKDRSGNAGPAIALLDFQAVASGSPVAPRRPFWWLASRRRPARGAQMEQEKSL